MTREPLWKQLKRQHATAGDLLAHFGFRVPAIDPFAIAEGLKVDVRPIPNPGWAGALQSDDSRAVIWLNESDVKVRQRFTLAHELGHLMLHETGVEFRDQRFWGSPKEVEANAFSADLLMPLAVLYPIAQHLAFDVAKLSRLFEVSPQAMAIRLQKFGVFTG